MVTVQQAFDLALQHHQAGRLAEAETVYRQILAVQPHHVDALHHLGVVACQAGRHDLGVEFIRQATDLNPNNPAAYSNLGAAYRATGQLEEAIRSYRCALQLRPDYPEALNNLSNALRERGQIDEAVAVCRQALELKPDYAEARNTLGIALGEQGRVDEAIVSHRSALELNPNDACAHSNLIYTLHFHPNCGDRTIAEEHQRWNRQFAQPLKQFVVPHANDRSPERRLRVGYVSPDFFFQAEAFFVVPLLEAHDHARYEIHCYASVVQTDFVTERLRRSAAVWHDVRGLSDHELAQQIRADEIDILVDLTMHMRRNRLLVFARKPAPVQVTWLAYPGSTGLATMDYRLTDPHLDPPKVETPYYSEQSVWLPDCWCCYHPLTDEPPINTLPAALAGGITFGCLNNFSKINSQTMELYGKALRAVEGSRLLLLAPEGSARQRILDDTHQHGIPPERIEFVGRIPRPDYLKLYHRIDIALDTLPYNGITTTCDALWMGVPVATLAGKTAAGRAGLGLLSAVGLSELATKSPEEFVRAVKQLASDLPRLAKLRQTLRARVEASVLMNAPRFARNIEAAYRAMWRRWCAEKAGA